ncbi:hypothetical protein AYI69_g6138 [Smittium culicis]|uniref:Uncharacterized protein n=1 Tax=Smittium culicis TaxID=133412 RepID=A0A1R1Y0Z9_9FUNG|nr:hypothetical protein AYI69_g6138 [Smittium culicis]
MHKLNQDQNVGYCVFDGANSKSLYNKCEYYPEMETIIIESLLRTQKIDLTPKRSQRLAKLAPKTPIQAKFEGLSFEKTTLEKGTARGPKQKGCLDRLGLNKTKVDIKKRTVSKSPAPSSTKKGKRTKNTAHSQLEI